MNKRNSNTNSFKKTLKKYSFPIIIGILLALITSKFFMISIVNGHSMDNTLHDKQVLFINRLHTLIFGIKPGDIIILKEKDKENEFLVKRVIAIENDTLELKDNKLYRNGQILKETYIKEPMINNSDFYLKIPQNELFFLGDNRNISYDSRQEGTYPMDSIVGKVMFVN